MGINWFLHVKLMTNCVTKQSAFVEAIANMINMYIYRVHRQRYKTDRFCNFDTNKHSEIRHEQFTFLFS